MYCNSTSHLPSEIFNTYLWDVLSNINPRLLKVATDTVHVFLNNYPRLTEGTLLLHEKRSNNKSLKCFFI